MSADTDHFSKARTLPGAEVDGGHLELALAAESTGWLGFGFSEPHSGGMNGADIVRGTLGPHVG